VTAVALERRASESAGRATRWTACAWTAAGVMALAVSCSLLRIPVQVPDSLIVMLQAQAAPSAWMGNFMGEQGFLRPLYGMQTRMLLDAAGASYDAVFRGFHAALVIALFALFVVVAKVRGRRDWAAFAFALLVLSGHHTFRGNVWEAYPINHYLEVAVCCLAAFALAQRHEPAWWSDALAAGLFLAAALTLESGLLVWVVLVAAWLTGLRGVSWRGIALVTALLAGYFYIRQVLLDTGMPGLDERAMGFGFGRLERDEVVERFADRPYVLYAYNVAASISSVVLSDPRSGTFEVARRLAGGVVTPAVLVSVISSLAATGLLVWYSARRVREWIARRFDETDALVLVFAAVVIANAVVSYGYTKDEVMSTAGAFYAVAVYGAARAALSQAAGIRSLVAGCALAILLCAASAAWAVRAAGVHYFMVYAAYYARDEWVEVDTWLRGQRAEPSSDEGRALVRTLRNAALDRPVVHPYFLPRWADRWFDVQ
jgi:hypothetical protein